MQHISPESLSDLPTRIKYLRDFIGFTSEDAGAIHASKPVVAPLVPVVVDAVYTKLFSFDITSKSFIPRQTGYEGETPEKLTDLNLEHPQIKFRRDFLAGYLVKLVTLDYEKDETWAYLDKVALMHTGEAGFAHRYVLLCFDQVAGSFSLSGLQSKETRFESRIHTLRHSPGLCPGHSHQRSSHTPRP